MIRRRLEILCRKWRSIKESPKFHDLVLFLIFVCISTLFWFVLAANDSAQDNFNVKVAITNVPDSVTFISDIPEKVHVSVRDKGTNLWRNHWRPPTISIDFRDYGENGILRFSKEDIAASLKSQFGKTATITSVSLDSLYLDYTTNKGKRVPVVIDAKVTAASGSVISGNMRSHPSSVYVYGEKRVLDTIHSVHTSLLTMKDISESCKVDVEMQKIAKAKIIPSKVEVEVTVEPLVKKEAMITITAINVPHDRSLLLFPSKIPVDYYVAMSHLGDNDDPDVELTVDYRDLLKSPASSKLGITIARFPSRLQNLTLKTDSVEYTVVVN